MKQRKRGERNREREREWFLELVFVQVVPPPFKVASKVSKILLHAADCNRAQCDQIWRNLATEANFKRLWQFSNGLLSIWPNSEYIVANLSYYWVNFRCCKWPNTEKVIQSSGHTDLVPNYPLLLRSQITTLSFRKWLS